jgi:hypothetical protein
MMQPAWRPWTADDDAPPSGQTLAISKSKTARPKQQGLRNVTNRQPHAASGERGGPKARLNKPQQSYYGPSPRVLRGQVADAAPAATAATAVVAAPANEAAAETVARDEQANAEEAAHPWDGRVRQLQQRFTGSPTKAIVEALEHTNGHAGKAARLLRSQWSPSALKTRQAPASEHKQQQQQQQ